MEKPINQDVHRQDYNGKRKKYTSGALRSSQKQAGADYPEASFSWNKAARPYAHNIKWCKRVVSVLEVYSSLDRSRSVVGA